MLAALLASGCGRHAAEQAGPSLAIGARTTAAPAQPGNRPQGATLAIAGTLFNGSDPDQIRAYLRTVTEIKPIKFDVQWSPQTVAVSKDEAMRALLGVSRDGSTFRFARAEPVVAKIKPGSILWIYDITVSHVDRVTTRGDIVVVHASPASLTQVFTRADIEFDAAPNLQNLYVAFRPHLKPNPNPATAAPRTSWVPPALRRGDAGPALGHVAYATVGPSEPRLMPAVWNGEAAPALVRAALAPPPDSSAPESSTPDSSTPDSSAPDSSAPDDEDDDPDGDYGETQAVGDAKTGKLMGFEYSLGYRTSPNGVSLQLEARKEEEGDDPFPEKRDEDEHEAQDAQADLQKQLHELAEIKSEQLTAHTSLNDMESEYDEMMKLNSRIADPSDRARAQQAETQQYQFRRNKVENQLAALDKARDAADKIEAEDKERLKKLGEAGKLVEQLFDVISDNLDLRFRVNANVSNFSVVGALMVLDAGKLDNFKAQFNGLQGHIHLDYVARMGKAGNGVVKLPVIGLPFVFNIPFPIGGLPLVIQLGSDFSVTTFLAGLHATQQFSGDYEFSGSEGIKATPSGATDETTMSGDAPEIGKAEAMSPGVSGLVLAIQVPRVGMGVGVFGASSVAYVDVVHVITMVNAAAANGAAMLSPLCKRTTYSAVGSVGIDTHIIPLPIPFVDKLDKALSTRKQVFEHHKEILDPPIKACEI